VRWLDGCLLSKAFVLPFLGSCRIIYALKTITLQKPGRFVLAQTDPPDVVHDGQALVRVHRVGICGTDLHAFRGRQPFVQYPRILGHELAVEVLQAAANDRGIQSADRCAVEPYLNCGRCIACVRGRPNCCVHLQLLGVHVDGGMREMIVVPIHKLHRSAGLTMDQLALVETLGIGAHAVARGQPQAGEWTLVLGAGPIGLGVILFAQLQGANVIVSDIREDRLAFCRQHLSVQWCVDARGDVFEQLHALVGDQLPTIVFDATGNRQSMIRCFDYVAHSGRLVLVGLVQGDISFNDKDLHRRELAVLATRNSTSNDFVRILRLMEEGRIDITPWVTDRVPMDAMIEHFPRWLDPGSGVIKAMVEL